MIYSEETQPLCYSIQNLSKAQLEALNRKITDQPVTATDITELNRIKQAMDNIIPLKPAKK